MGVLSGAASAKGIDRRRFPRVRIYGELASDMVVPFKLSLNVIDVGKGGFSVESPIPFVQHGEYAFQFRSPDRRYPTLKAASVHCLETSRGSARSYIAGFRFVQDTAHDRQAIEDMLHDIHAIAF